jgi:hypothetical protein
MADRPLLPVSGARDLFFGRAFRHSDQTIDVTVYRSDGSVVVDLTSLRGHDWPGEAIRRLRNASLA